MHFVLFGYFSAQMKTPKNPVARILGVALAYLMIASFCLISRPVYAEDRPASEYLKLSAQSSPPEVHPKWVKMFVSNTNPGRRIEATLHVNVEHYAPPHYRKLNVEEKVVHIPAAALSSMPSIRCRNTSLMGAYGLRG